MKPDAPVSEFMEAMVRLGSAQLIDRLRIDEAEARGVMESITRAIILEYGKRQLYVPADLVNLVLAPRNAEIWTEFHQPGPDGSRPCTPKRAEQLAAKHYLTTRQIYAIIKDQRDADLASRQSTLPGLSDDPGG